MKMIFVMGASPKQAPIRPKILPHGEILLGFRGGANLAPPPLRVLMGIRMFNQYYYIILISGCITSTIYPPDTMNIARNYFRIQAINKHRQEMNDSFRSNAAIICSYKVLLKVALVVLMVLVVLVMLMWFNPGYTSMLLLRVNNQLVIYCTTVARHV